MRDKEEVKLAIDDFRLLDEAIIDVGTLGRVVDVVLAVVLLSLLEESLTDTLVHDDQRDLRGLLLVLLFNVVLTSIQNSTDIAGCFSEVHIL